MRHERVRPLAESFTGVAFSFDETFPLEQSWQDEPYRGLPSGEVTRLAVAIPAFSDLPVKTVQEIAESMTLESYFERYTRELSPLNPR